MEFLHEISLILTCEEEEGERKQGRKKGIEGERKRSSSGQGGGDGASTAGGFPGTLDIRVMTIY